MSGSLHPQRNRICTAVFRIYVFFVKMYSTFEAKYKIVEQIGEGSFSEVLKCEHRNSRKCFAAKRLKKNYKCVENILKCPEIIAARKLSPHTNLLNMLEYHFDPFYGKAIFIFELMDMSMYDYLRTKKKGLSECRVRNYLYQVLNGLDHLHSHGLFHRDVKPENILIKFPSILYTPLSQNPPKEIVKLADLGSIRGIFSQPPYTEYISTRWYRSPECLLTMGNYGSKMDVWATGCVFYEMLTLKPLFPGSNEIDQLYKIHQVVGTPPFQFLQRLKTHSQNCISFPKIKGCGVDLLVPFITKNGRNVFRLMIEYDPEKRINVRRLLRNIYFDEFRYPPETIPTHKPKVVPHGCKRSIGDDGSFPVLYPHLRKKAVKREHYSDELHRSKDSSLSSISKQNSLSSTNERKCRCSEGRSSNKSSAKSSIDQSSATSCAKIIYNMNSLPLVEYKVHKLGVNKTPLHVTPVKQKNVVDNIMCTNKKSLKSRSTLETGMKCMPCKHQFASKSLILAKKTELCKNSLGDSKVLCKARKRLIK